MSKLFVAISALLLVSACGKDQMGAATPDASPDTRMAAGGGTGTGGAGLGGQTAVGSGGAAAKGGTVGTGGRAGSGGTGGTEMTGGRTGTTTGSGGRKGSDAGVGTGGRTTPDGGVDLGGADTRGNSDGSPSTGGAVGSGGRVGTGGATGSGGGTGACSSPPEASALVGWASQSGNGVTTTTGGGSATPITVTSLADLQAAAKGTNAAVIYVKGVLAAGSISVGSNKTIVGLCGAEIHGHVELSGSSNVIIRNIKIVGYAVGDCAKDPSYDPGEGCSSGQDLISVQKDSHHIWFDHCDISDGTDGNLDITNGADFVTVSWTKFHYTPRTDNQGNDSTGAAGHRFSNLVGGSDSKTTDAGKLNVTWHHNWWADNVVERQPRVRFGKNHIFNNLYTSTSSNYCVRAGIQAHLLLENNVFSGVKDPHEFNNSDDQGTAHITASGNLYTSVSGDKATGGGGTPFTDPPYAYTLDATANLLAAIQAGAGPK